MRFHLHDKRYIICKSLSVNHKSGATFSEIKNEKTINRLRFVVFAIEHNGAEIRELYSIRQSFNRNAENGTHVSRRDRSVRLRSAFARHRPAAA